LRTFERRIYMGFAAVAVSFVPLIFMAFWSLHKILSEEREVIAVNTEQLLDAEKLEYYSATQEALIPLYVLSGDPKLLDRHHEQHLRFQKTLQNLKRSEIGGEMQARLARIDDLSRRLNDLARPGIALREDGEPIDAVHDYFTTKARPLARQLNQELVSLRAIESEELQAAQAQIGNTADWITYSLCFFLVISAALIALVGRLIFKTLRHKQALDLSQQEVLKKEQELSQARKEIVEVVAHDLKAPLATINMSLELILETLSAQKNPDVERGLQIVQRSASSMRGLIDNLLDHAKIESDHLILEKSACDVAKLLKDLCQRFELLAREKGVVLKYEIPDGWWLCYCDASRMEQVMSNLLANALKFTPRDGEIRTRLWRENGAITVAIQDTGLGIEADQLNHIFERFWQAKKTAKLGTGLGLAISKAIVEAHGGRIWAESTPGRGTQFFVRLPPLHASTETPIPEPRLGSAAFLP